MFPLTTEDKRFLLSLARKSLEAAVCLQTVDEPEHIPFPLKKPGSAFVCLHEHSRLRGCVGYVLPVKPLYRTVMEAAPAAALNDPRFPRVRPDELPGLEIEISVLSAFCEVGAEGIQIGSHGLIVSQGSRRGLLLPQVAVEHSWTAAKFLEETCRKAGLPAGAWRRGAKVEAFTAVVFSELAVMGERAAG